jgi:hypothetical protein
MQARAVAPTLTSVKKANKTAWKACKKLGLPEADRLMALGDLALKERRLPQAAADYAAVCAVCTAHRESAAALAAAASASASAAAAAAAAVPELADTVALRPPAPVDARVAAEAEACGKVAKIGGRRACVCCGVVIQVGDRLWPLRLSQLPRQRQPDSTSSAADANAAVAPPPAEVARPEKLTDAFEWVHVCCALSLLSERSGSGSGGSGGSSLRAPGEAGGALDSLRRLRRGAPLCKHFARRGECVFGEACFYRHERPAAAEAASVSASAVHRPASAPAAGGSAAAERRGDRGECTGDGDSDGGGGDGAGGWAGAGATGGSRQEGVLQASERERAHPHPRGNNTSNSCRAGAFRRWLLDTFGRDGRALSAGSGVLDVAGGKVGRALLHALTAAGLLTAL